MVSFRTRVERPAATAQRTSLPVKRTYVVSKEPVVVYHYKPLQS